VTPYDAQTGNVWDFEGELFIMLDVFMSDLPYRMYVSLDTGKFCWMGRHSARDDNSELVT